MFSVPLLPLCVLGPALLAAEGGEVVVVQQDPAAIRRSRHAKTFRLTLILIGSFAFGCGAKVLTAFRCTNLLASIIGAFAALGLVRSLRR